MWRNSLILRRSYDLLSHPVDFDVYHMSITCLLHVHHMSITCVSHAYHMSITCPSNVFHMCITYLSHVYHMSITCLSHVYHMRITCPSHVYHMCITRLSSRFPGGYWQPRACASSMSVSVCTCSRANVRTDPSSVARPSSRSGNVSQNSLRNHW